MKPKSVLFGAFLMLSSSVSALSHNQTRETDNYYILHHDSLYAPLDDVARLLGLQIVEPIGNLRGMWLTRTEASPTLVGRAGDDQKDDPILASYWKMRRQTSGEDNQGPILSAIKHLSREIPHQVEHRSPRPAVPLRRRQQQDTPSAIAKRLGIKDPAFETDQWFLANPRFPERTHNVVRAWEELGVTGAGVTVAIVDDGLRSDHKDLQSNFAKEQSYDFVGGTKQLPKPTEADDHGTPSAGIIAAAKNEICGVGIAFNAKVAGLRIMSEGQMKASDEADGLTHRNQDVSIYSCGYGPPTQGKKVIAPSYVTKKALVDGVTQGRGTKGSIFVFAGGNYHKMGDSCNYDGWVNSIYTIGIGALDEDNKHAEYSSTCTALMAVTYSNKGRKHPELFSLSGVGSDDACGETTAQTSAAAPAAAGIFALALEARPELSWRDMQYLIVETARRIDGHDGWDTSSKHKYSEELGFGVLDAYAFVKAAKTWPLVKPQVWMSFPPVAFEGGAMTRNGEFTGGKPLSKSGVSHTIEVTQKMVNDGDFDTVEHVQLRVWVQHERRGNILVTLTGPGGVVSEMGKFRPLDSDPTGLQGWTFSSVKHWGQDPKGSWTINISSRELEDITVQANGKAIGFTMTLWGSAKGSRRNSEYKSYQLPEDDYNIFPPEKV